MIGKLGLFSANETKEDISTTNLKYILVSVGFDLIFHFFSFLRGMNQWKSVKFVRFIDILCFLICICIREMIVNLIIWYSDCLVLILQAKENQAKCEIYSI